MRDWIKDSSSTIWSHQLMLSKSKTKFCLGEYFRVVSLKLRSTILTSNEESKKEKKNENIEKGIQRKLWWCFQQTWWRNILENTYTQLQNLLCFLQIKPTLMKNRYLWKEKFKRIHFWTTGTFVLNPYSISNWKCVFLLPIYPIHIVFLDFLGFCNLMSPGISSLSNRYFSYPWCLS